VSKSDNGDIDGNWTVLPEFLFGEDGGHGMLFKDIGGKLFFAMHSPNIITLERPVIYPACERDGKLTLE